MMIVHLLYVLLVLYSLPCIDRTFFALTGGDGSIYRQHLAHYKNFFKFENIILEVFQKIEFYTLKVQFCRRM